MYKQRLMHCKLEQVRDFGFGLQQSHTSTPPKFTMATKKQELPSREASLFRTLIKQYETKLVSKHSSRTMTRMRKGQRCHLASPPPASFGHWLRVVCRPYAALCSLFVWSSHSGRGTALGMRTRRACARPDTVQRLVGYAPSIRVALSQNLAARNPFPRTIS